MKVLFVCNQNQNRSCTAEELFSDRVDTRSAGLYNANPITKAELEWSEIVVVMEEAQRREIGRRFPQEYMKKQIINLDIPDVYRHQDEKLISLLISRWEQVVVHILNTIYCDEFSLPTADKISF